MPVCEGTPSSKKSYPRRDTKDDEGPRSVTDLPHGQGCSPASRRAALGTLLNYWNKFDQPLLNCCDSMGFLTGALPVISVIQQRPLFPPGWRRWPRLFQDVCGRDARAPGWASSREVVAAKEVGLSSCSFVDIFFFCPLRIVILTTRSSRRDRPRFVSTSFRTRLCPLRPRSQSPPDWRSPGPAPGRGGRVRNTAARIPEDSET